MVCSVSALKSHGDSNMSEKEVVDLAVKAEEGVYAKHPTNKVLLTTTVLTIDRKNIFLS